MQTIIIAPMRYDNGCHCARSCFRIESTSRTRGLLTVNNLIYGPSSEALLASEGIL